MTVFRFGAYAVFAVATAALVMLGSVHHAYAKVGLITLDELKKISPRGKEEYMQVIVDAEPEFEKAGINTRLRMAHFLTQVMTETGGLKRLDEWLMPTGLHASLRRLRIGCMAHGLATGGGTRMMVGIIAGLALSS